MEKQFLLEEDSKRLCESNPALTESVKVMLREKSPLARRFFAEDEKYRAEYWVSPEGQKIMEQLRQEASEGAQ